MIGRETWMLLRHYLEHGASKSALARQLGTAGLVTYESSWADPFGTPLTNALASLGEDQCLNFGICANSGYFAVKHGKAAKPAVNTLRKRALWGRSGSGDRCTTNPRHATTRNGHSGSIYGVGGRFQSFRINDLEMVAQIFTSWNPMTSWMRQIEGFQRAA